MEIYQLVTNLIKKHKTNCPFELASRLGIQVRFLDLPLTVRGYYFRTLGRRFIAINQNYGEIVQRFVCAHELGHDRLHKSMGFYFVEQNTLYQQGKFERQANTFAICLLLANAEILDGDTIKQIYSENGIPPEMADSVHPSPYWFNNMKVQQAGTKRIAESKEKY